MTPPDRGADAACNANASADSADARANPDASASADSAPPAVRLTGVCFAYPGGGHRLRDVSFSVEPGRLCALLGPNGAGKTTLLRCLLGLLRPHAGTVEVHGADVTGLPGRELARRLAYVPQTSTTPFPFTALDMAVMGRTPHLGLAATPSAADRRAALEQLDRLGIAHLAGRPFPSLSGGERQLTLLARALVQRASVLVLDEPTASLDYGNEIRFLDLAAELVRAGHAVVMTTHQPGHALTHADRVVLLRAGRVVDAGPPDRVVTGEALTELYGAGIHVASVPVPGSDDVQRTCFPIRATRRDHPDDLDP